MALSTIPQNILVVDTIRDVKFNMKLSCSICSEDYDSKVHIPKVLTCGHSVCVNCLNTMLKAVQVSYSGNGEVYTRFTCPMCRASMEIPARGAEGFASNFQLLEAIVPQDSRIMACPMCKLNGSESSFHICRECTIRDHGFDIHRILNEEPEIHPDTFTICSTCVLKEHNSPGHTVIEYVPVRLDYQFKKNKKSVDVLQTQMSQKFSEVRVILATMPQIVAKKEAEIQKIVDFMERAKNRQNLDKIFEKYKAEMDGIIKMLDVLRTNGAQLTEMVDQKVKILEKDNEEIDKMYCFPTKTDLRKVLKTEDDVVELPEDVKKTSEMIQKLKAWIQKKTLEMEVGCEKMKVPKVFDDGNWRHQMVVAVVFVVLFGMYMIFF